MHVSGVDSIATGRDEPRQSSFLADLLAILVGIVQANYMQRCLSFVLKSRTKIVYSKFADQNHGQEAPPMVMNLRVTYRAVPDMEAYAPRCVSSASHQWQFHETVPVEVRPS
jgi:hypothetical protein